MRAHRATGAEKGRGGIGPLAGAGPRWSAANGVGSLPTLVQPPLAPDTGWGVLQEGGQLGERLHAVWEWDALLEQVAEFGWTDLDIR